MNCINLYNLIFENFSICLPTFNHARGKPAQRGDVREREPFGPGGQVPSFQLIVSAPGDERVSIRREAEGIGGVRIPAQGIEIVAEATLPEEAPLEIPQISLPWPWPMSLDQFPGA